MEGGGRSSTALLLLLALTLAASSATTAAAAAAQRRQPPGDGSYSYKLITIQTVLGDKVKLAVRADDSSIAGFANNKNDWFNIQGSEDLLESALRSKYGGGGGGGGNNPGNDGLVSLLGSMLNKKNATS